jgi:glycosyltransferase involved in cell wall biosynthesis
LGDVAATRAVAAEIARVQPDVIHGHGAKGAAYARLARAPSDAIRVYTPHGGSLHYRPGTPAGIVFNSLEKILRSRTDLFLFESEFIRDLFNRQVGAPRAIETVVHNGVAGSEFAEVALAPSATDLLYIGELRALKGIEVLIHAIAALRASGTPLTATIVGDGPDREALRALTQARGIGDLVRFPGAMPARQAFTLGKVMVVPSFKESLPYVVLEAGAAAKPLISTNAGGIPEIFGPDAGRLIAPGDRDSLMSALAAAVNDPETMRAATRALQARIRTVFSIDSMVDGGLAAYGEALRHKRRQV